METRNIICISCPIGCSIKVDMENEDYKISGNLCKRGMDYALSEMTDPRRIITTSMFVNDGVFPTVSVKTSNPLPKEKIFDCIRELASIRVDAPVKIGDVIVRNILNTGIDIIATRAVDKSINIPQEAGSTINIKRRNLEFYV